MKSSFLILFLIFSLLVNGQHLYSEKFKGCVVDKFCLDCGDIKAEAPSDLANQLLSGFNKNNLKNISGTIEVQILIDSLGNPCLLSASNKTQIKSSKLKLQEAINGVSSWKPAMSKNKAVKSSVSLMFSFENNYFNIKRRNFDSKNETNMRSVGKPDAKGSKEEDLSGTWEVFTQSNSKLPWDMTRAITNDKANNIWIGTDNGIVKIHENEWTIFNTQNSTLKAVPYDKNKTSSIRHMAVDGKDNKWFIAAWDVYKYDNEKWTCYDSINSPIKWARNIFVDKKDNVWFTSWDGVSKFDGKNWTVLDKNGAGLPSDKVLGVFVDSKDRIWIGTFEGNVIIENGKTKGFTNDTPLSKAYISKMIEDKEGDLWFSLYQEKGNEAGIYKLKSNGVWEKISYKNNKLFSENSINDFLLDEENNSLWITLNGVGVMKYDILKKNWEIYTNENSNVPSIHAEQITKDNDGNIWIATYAGVIKFQRK